MTKTPNLTIFGPFCPFFGKTEFPPGVLFLPVAKFLEKLIGGFQLTLVSNRQTYGRTSMNYLQDLSI